MKVKLDQVYRYFNTKQKYRVIALGQHALSLEEMVVIKAITDAPVEVLICPIDRFLEEVESQEKGTEKITKIPRYSLESEE